MDKYLINGKICLSSLPTLSLRQQCNKFSNAARSPPRPQTQLKPEETLSINILRFIQTHIESSRKGLGVAKSTQKICLVSTSEIKAGKEQFDHEVSLRQKIDNQGAGKEIYITNNQGSSSS